MSANAQSAGQTRPTRSHREGNHGDLSCGVPAERRSERSSTSPPPSQLELLPADSNTSSPPPSSAASNGSGICANPGSLFEDPGLAQIPEPLAEQRSEEKTEEEIAAREERVALAVTRREKRAARDGVMGDPVPEDLRALYAAYDLRRVVSEVQQIAEWLDGLELEGAAEASTRGEGNTTRAEVTP